MKQKPEFDWTVGVVPTSYGTGPFHPAIRNGNKVWYWPNITMPDEDAAYHRACLSLADAVTPAAEIVSGWNIWEAAR